MKKLLLLLWFTIFSLASYSQTISSLPSSLGNIQIFRDNPFSITLQFPNNYSIPQPVTADLYQLVGSAGTKINSITPTVNVTGQNVTVNLTTQNVSRIASLSGNIGLYIKFNDTYLFGSIIKTVIGVGVPSVTPFTVNIPSAGNVNISLIGASGAAQRYAQIADSLANVSKSASTVATAQAVLAASSALTAQNAASTASIQYELKGSYDASTNTPTLTSDASVGQTNPNKPQKYIIVKKGVLAFNISGKSQGDSIGLGELIQSPSNMWFYNPYLLTENSISTKTIIDTAVTPIKTSFFKIGKNLADKSKVIENYGITNDYLIVQSNNNSIFRIEVKPNATYTYYVDTQFPSSVKIRFENSSKALISGINANGAAFSTLPYTFTTPANCKYVVLNARTSTVTGAENTAQFEQGSIRTTYEPFNLKILQSDIRGNFAEADTVGKNLVDPSTMLVNNFGLDNSYNIVASPNNALYRIPVKPLTVYTYYVQTTFPSSVKLRYETSTGVFISGYNANAESFLTLPVTFTTPANCYYLITNARTSQNANEGLFAQLEQSPFRSSYEPFNLKINNKKIDQSPVLTKSVFLPWKSKKVIFVGNSIVFLNYFQPFVQAYHEFVYTNNAISGSCMAAGKENAAGDGTIRPAIVNRITEVSATNSDLIMIMGGTNDWLYNVPIGSISDTTKTTFYGAVKSVIINLQANNPAKRIVFATPLQRTNNRANFTAQKQYADVIKEVCGMYSVPVLDLFYSSGITYENINQFTSDNVHPNPTIGAPYIARLISSFFFRL